MARNTIKFNVEDYELFLKMFTYQYVDIMLVINFCYPRLKEETKIRRLRQLEACGFIKSISVFIPEGLPIKLSRYYKVYTLDNKAKVELKYGYGITANYNPVLDNSPYYVYHQILLAYTIESFKQAIEKDSDIEFVRCLNESDMSYYKLKIRPDLTMLIKYQGQLICYFIELERSYSNDEKVKNKISRYNAIYNNHQLKEIDADIKDARVLFVESTRNRHNSVELLSKKIKECKNNIVVLVGEFEEVFNNPLGKVFNWRDDNKYGILSKIK